MTVANKIKHLDFDSEHFGIKKAKITDVDHADPKKDLANIIEYLKLNNYKYAVYRVNSKAFNVIHELQNSGFLLVDTFVALAHPGKTKNSYVKPDVIVKAQKTNIDELKKIAHDSFSGTRFFNDPFLSKKLAQELYAKWVENCVNGKINSDVYAYYHNSKIVGFITYSLDEGTKNGHIILIAVLPGNRGLGIGRRLVDFAVFKLFEKGAKQIEIETQGSNIAAIRSYIGAGFKITDSMLTFRLLL